MWGVVGVIVVVVAVVYLLAVAELDWILVGGVWILGGAFLLVLGIGIQSGAISGPGLEPAPLWAAVSGLSFGLFMILYGARRIWSGLFDGGVVKRPPPWY